MAENEKQQRRKIKSPDYPAISLLDAVQRAQKIYEKDHTSWIPTEVAAQHLGYSGLTGMSRAILSALRKFGLVEYKGGDLKVTEDAMKVLEPTNDEEKAEQLATMLETPRMYQTVKEFSGTWQLPSPETLRAKLIREHGFNPSAVGGFITDLQESIDYVNQHRDVLSEQRPEKTPDEVPDSKPVEKSKSPELPTGLHRFSVPGENWLVAFPDDLTPQKAKKMREWITKVVLPNLDFLSSNFESEEEPD